MARKKAEIKTSISLVYLLIILVVILLAVIAYLSFFKPIEAPIVVASEEEAVEVQQDLSTSISDIKDDLELLKKSLGK